MKMNTESIKEKIHDFLTKHSLCVISTMHVEGKGPESALVAFAERDTLEIIFGTSNTSRKYKNIHENNHVSLVIGWNPQLGSIQYEGIANEVPHEQSSEYAALQVSKNPGSHKFVEREDQRYFVVTPTWIRFIDNAGNPPDTYEITL